MFLLVGGKMNQLEKICFFINIYEKRYFFNLLKLKLSSKSVIMMKIKIIVAKTE